MFYNYISKYTEIFCCTAKASHIFSTKNIGIFEILTFEIFKETLTNDVDSFEQPGPGEQIQNNAIHSFLTLMKV